jgi:hypothetical protein
VNTHAPVTKRIPRVQSLLAKQASPSKIGQQTSWKC